MLNHVIVNTYNFWVVTFVALGTISTAYGLAIIGSTVGQPNFYTYFNLPGVDDPNYIHTSNMIAALNGVNSGGAILGCFFNVWGAEKIGRKWTMMVGCVILIVGGAICSGAVNMAMFIVGRGIAGMGSGILACIVPMYQSEVSTPESRGAMVSITGIAYALGYTLAGWLGYACSFMSGTSKYSQFAWRFPLAFQCFFPLVVLLGYKFVPYSPRWLLSQGRSDEAFEIVCNLHRMKSDPQNIRAKEEFYLISKQYEMDASLPNRPFELFRTVPNLKRAGLGALLMFGNQFLGVYVMANYGVLIYAQLGEGGHIPLLLNAVWTTVTIVGNTWTAFYVDKYGRRPLLIIGSIGCLVSAIFLCAMTASFTGTTNEAGLRGAVFFCFFYIFWWCFFIDATQYVYLCEIFPNHLRAAGVALGIGAFYLGSEVTLVATPIAMTNIGWKFYLVFICPSACYVVSQFFLFPETKGRTLEEIGAIFGDTNIANKWYGLDEEERNKIHEQILHPTSNGNGDNENGLPDENSVEEVKDGSVQQLENKQE